MAAACCGKRMYLENDRNFCVCTSSNGSNMRKAHFEESMKESEECFIATMSSMCSAPAPLPHSGYRDSCMPSCLRCSPRIGHCNKSSAITLSERHDLLKKETNLTIPRQILEIEVESAVMANQGSRLPAIHTARLDIYKSF